MSADRPTTCLLFSRRFLEPLTTGGLPYIFANEAEAQAVAVLYPEADLVPMPTDAAGVEPTTDLLLGRLVLAHTEDRS